MELEVLPYENGMQIPCEFTFCVPADEGHVSMGSNRSPHVLAQASWLGTYTLNPAVEA